MMRYTHFQAADENTVYHKESRRNLECLESIQVYQHEKAEPFNDTVQYVPGAMISTICAHGGGCSASGLFGSQRLPFGFKPLRWISRLELLFECWTCQVTGQAEALELCVSAGWLMWRP